MTLTPLIRAIYKLGFKHGMRLASISDVNGVYSEEDFDQAGSATWPWKPRAAAGKKTGKAKGAAS